MDAPLPAQAHELMRTKLVGKKVCVTLAMGNEIENIREASIAELRPAVMKVTGVLKMTVGPSGDMFQVEPGNYCMTCFWCEDVLMILHNPEDESMIPIIYLKTTQK